MASAFAAERLWAWNGGMMFFALIIVLLIVVLAALAWVNHGVYTVTVNQAAHMTLIESIQAELKMAQDQSRKRSAYGWNDDWPDADHYEYEMALYRWRVQNRNAKQPWRDPRPWGRPDDFATRLQISEYRSISNPHERKEFLRKLHKANAWIDPELLELIYADENEFVRAWAAGHLATSCGEERNYEPALFQDPQAIVRAALWSNPKCQRLPWSYIVGDPSDGWKDDMRRMSQLERLGLMRNPELSDRFVVALLETPSEQLGMSRNEHVQVLRAAAENPRLVRKSNSAGRTDWVGGGEGNPPFKEFGTMWTLCLDKWSDTILPDDFFKHIQTTPEIKQATYQRLLEEKQNAPFKELRKNVILSCDPQIDGPVLKMAWDDSDQDFRELAKERIGVFIRDFEAKQEREPPKSSRWLRGLIFAGWCIVSIIFLTMAFTPRTNPEAVEKFTEAVTTTCLEGSLGLWILTELLGARKLTVKGVLILSVAIYVVGVGTFSLYLLSAR